MVTNKGRFEVVLAGLGGQGVLLSGKLLAEAGALAFDHVAFCPNYGSAMRGASSEALVILSPQEILSTIIWRIQSAVIMHPQFLASYTQRLKPGGSFFLDSTLVKEKVGRNDVHTYYVPASEAAAEMGTVQAANLVMLGAYLRVSEALPFELVDRCLEARLKAGALLSANKEALRRGADLVNK